MALLLVPLAACVHSNGGGRAHGKDAEQEKNDIYWHVGRHSKHLESFLAWCVEGEQVDVCGKYEYIFADAKHLSYRAKESIHGNCWVHGRNYVTVGTLDRKTKHRLTIEDIAPGGKKAEMLAKLKVAVAKKIGGEKNLIGEVKLTENFYIAKDGVHFVFNEYQVAPFAVGPIDVVVR